MRDQKPHESMSASEQACCRGRHAHKREELNEVLQKHAVIEEPPFCARRLLIEFVKKRVTKDLHAQSHRLERVNATIM